MGQGCSAAGCALAMSMMEQYVLAGRQRKTNNNPPDNPEQRPEKTAKQRCPADKKEDLHKLQKIASQRQEWIAFTAEIKRTAKAARPDDQASGRH
ncbi:hypothetical protein ElyMa_001314200 [Elysia marginata]|uniref:MADF domain-containing protein n=1 Tax=Elysia marginata TaxID=1093978 RepID=A0AAV4IIN7_9GAST|nr:hypothetical protein ElyMa_001314200 [Elysia marginata]